MITRLFLFLLLYPGAIAASGFVGDLEYKFCKDTRCYKIISESAETERFFNNQVVFKNLELITYKKRGGRYEETTRHKSSLGVFNKKGRILVTEKQKDGQLSFYLNMNSGKFQPLESIQSSVD